MRKSVADAWPTFCERWEGVCYWMYLDTKGLVTTGTGNLIDPVSRAQLIEWVNLDGSIAAKDEIATEWSRVKKLTSLKKYNGLNKVWSSSAHLKLTRTTVAELLMEVTNSFWDHLLKTLPKLESFPADAQLAIMDEAWQNGEYFLDPGTVWTGTRAAVLAQDWAAAASHVPGDGDRTDARKRLFNNAASVVKLKLDPNILWDTKKPITPSVPTPAPTPAPTPPKETVMHSSKWGTDYVSWRGGYFAPITVEKLKAIPSTASVVQGGLSFAKASAQTHAGIGAFDLSVRGLNKSQVWKLCTELWQVDIIPCPRGFVADSFQGRTISNINDGNEHVHCLDLDSVSSMHPQAKAQVKEILAGGDGLLGNAHYTGPSKSNRTSWSKSPYNPKNIAAAKAKADAAAREKELELPTAKELAADDDFLLAIAKKVISVDGLIENTFTGNPENKEVALGTAVTYLGSRSLKAEKSLANLNAKLDAQTKAISDLAAAVAAARFPGGTA